MNARKFTGPEEKNPLFLALVGMVYVLNWKIFFVPASILMTTWLFNKHNNVLIEESGFQSRYSGERRTFTFKNTQNSKSCSVWSSQKFFYCDVQNVSFSTENTKTALTLSDFLKSTQNFLKRKILFSTFNVKK